MLWRFLRCGDFQDFSRIFGIFEEFSGFFYKSVRDIWSDLSLDFMVCNWTNFEYWSSMELVLSMLKK